MMASIDCVPRCRMSLSRSQLTKPETDPGGDRSSVRTLRDGLFQTVTEGDWIKGGWLGGFAEPVFSLSLSDGRSVTGDDRHLPSEYRIALAKETTRPSLEGHLLREPELYGSCIALAKIVMPPTDGTTGWGRFDFIIVLEGF